MRKQFDLEYYLAHPNVKVVTRDGRKVRILCTDLNDKDYPIAASCPNLLGNRNDVDNYAADGKVLFGSHSENIRDLFFDIPDPEKKRVPLTHDDLLERIKSGKTMWLVNDRDIVFHIVDFDNDSAYYIYGATEEILHVSYKDMMNGLSFSDGDPTWKEVEE